MNDTESIIERVRRALDEAGSEIVDDIKTLPGGKFEHTITVRRIVTEPEHALKQDIRDYCREHRVWAARDENGRWVWYLIRDKPFVDKDIGLWLRESFTESSTDPGFSTLAHTLKGFTFPDCPWDKSLIAPDGSMPLMEQKPRVKILDGATKPILQAMREFAAMNRTPKRGWIIGHLYSFCSEQYELLEIESDKHIVMAPYPNKHSARVRFPNSIDIWTHVGPKKPATPKRGDPVFVWDDGSDPRTPAHIEYFHNHKGSRVMCFAWGQYGVCGLPWDHYRPFDPALVGVPRREWPNA